MAPFISEVEIFQYRVILLRGASFPTYSEEGTSHVGIPHSRAGVPVKRSGRWSNTNGEVNRIAVVTSRLRSMTVGQ